MGTLLWLLLLSLVPRLSLRVNKRQKPGRGLGTRLVASHLNEGELLFQFSNLLVLLLQSFLCISYSLLSVRPTLSVGNSWSCRVMFGKGIHSRGWVALVKDPLTIRVRVQIQHLRVKSLVSVLVNDEESAGIGKIRHLNCARVVTIAKSHNVRTIPLVQTWE